MLKGPEEEEVGPPSATRRRASLTLQAGTIIRPFHIPEVTERMPSVNLRRAASGSPRFRRKQEARSHEWGEEQKQRLVRLRKEAWEGRGAQDVSLRAGTGQRLLPLR